MKLPIKLLKAHGFQWVKDRTTDRVEASHIAKIIPAAGGFTVVYTNDPAVVLQYSTVRVKEIEIPQDINGQWIRVHWINIVDEYKNGEVK